MEWTKICTVLVVTFTLAFVQQTTGAPSINNRPVVGVLAQETFDSKKIYGEEYVMSEYIKFLEMSGASVVIVKGEQPYDYYVQMFKSLNGILLPGGGVDLVTSPYAKSSRILYSLAIQANDKGDYFPIWGTCQGFEMMTVLTAKKDLLVVTDSENLSLPLQLLPSYNESRMLGKAPREIISYLTSENITANFHHLCLSTETFINYKPLNKFYRAISVNVGRSGPEYISTMEAFHYPFYAVQWHPEKNIFSRRTDQSTAHSAHAIEVTQYMGNFFVNEARKNLHKYSSEALRSHAVVENDDRVYLPKHYIEDFFYNVTKT